MRVLLASPGMNLGGAERVVVSLAAGLSARGHAVAVSGARGPLDAELAATVTRLYLPERGRSPAGAAEWALRLAPAVRAFSPHVVHGHNAKATVAASVAARLARGPRRPAVVATHHGAADANEAAAAGLLSRAADEVAVVSEDLLPIFENRGISGERLHVVLNGIAGAPPLTPAARAALDAELDAGDRPVVAAVGRLVPVKGLERFLRMAALVHAAHPDVRFLVVGDGPLRSALERLATTLRLDGAVRFTGARTDARALMARADLMVVASDSEGLSIAALEALGAGTPVVSTPVAGMRGLLSGGAGTIVGDFTPQALAAAVIGLLRAPAARADMGRAGAQLVQERFSADAMVAAYERRYEAVIVRSRRYGPTIHSPACS